MQLLHDTCSGHEGVVEIVLGGAEVNPDKPDNDGWTPLLHVALEAHERVVKRLKQFTGMRLTTGILLTHSNHWKIKSTFDYHNK